MDATPLVPSAAVRVTVTLPRYQPFAPDGPARVWELRGAERSATVQVSFPAGAGSTLPARSVAMERNAYVCPSIPVNVPLVTTVSMSPATGVHAPPSSLTSRVYVAMSVVPPLGPQETANVAIVMYRDKGATAEPGGVTSTIVHVSLPGGVDSTFPARSVEMDRNSYVWPSAPLKSEEVAVVDAIHAVQAPPLSRASMR